MKMWEGVGKKLQPNETANSQPPRLPGLGLQCVALYCHQLPHLLSWQRRSLGGLSKPRDSASIHCHSRAEPLRPRISPAGTGRGCVRAPHIFSSSVAHF